MVIFLLLCGLGAQHRPAASAQPGLIEMQVLRAHPRPTELQNLPFNGISATPFGKGLNSLLLECLRKRPAFLRIHPAITPPTSSL